MLNDRVFYAYNKPQSFLSKLWGSLQITRRFYFGICSRQMNAFCTEDYSAFRVKRFMSTMVRSLSTLCRYWATVMFLSQMYS